MAVLNTPLFLISAFFVSSAHAQMVFRGRRSTAGRIVAGCIVAVLFALFLICVLVMLSRRRRARTLMAVNPGGGVPQNAQFGPKPLFGGLWGRSNAGYYGQNGSSSAPYENNGPNYNVPYGTAPIQAPQAPYNPEYPSQYAPPPPPPYGKEANYGQAYSPPPSSPPPHTRSSDQPYTPPPGPPPPAHTTGQDNSFVGGFRS